MDFKLSEESLGPCEKHHQSLVEGCWGREPIILLHFWPTAQDTKWQEQAPGKEMHVLIEVGLMCAYIEMTRKGL